MDKDPDRLDFSLMPIPTASRRRLAAGYPIAGPVEARQLFPTRWVRPRPVETCYKRELVASDTILPEVCLRALVYFLITNSWLAGFLTDAMNQHLPHVQP